MKSLVNAQNPQDGTKDEVEMRPVVDALYRLFEARLNSDDPEVRTRTRSLDGVPEPAGANVAESTEEAAA